MRKTSDGYYLQVIACKYITGWAKVRSPIHGTLETAADFFLKEEMCWFGIQDCEAVDSGAEYKKCSDRIFKC